MTKYREILRLKHLGFSEREHRKDGGRIPQHGETCRGGRDSGQDRLDACREHGRRDNREGALPRQETGTAEPHDRLRVHPQGAASERRDEETALDRILRELPALQPRAAHVLVGKGAFYYKIGA